MNYVAGVQLGAAGAGSRVYFLLVLIREMFVARSSGSFPRCLSFVLLLPPSLLLLASITDEMIGVKNNQILMNKR